LLQFLSLGFLCLFKNFSKKLECFTGPLFFLYLFKLCIEGWRVFLLLSLRYWGLDIERDVVEENLFIIKLAVKLRMLAG
jgi:hypothetical protein